MRMIISMMRMGVTDYDDYDGDDGNTMQCNAMGI